MLSISPPAPIYQQQPLPAPPSLYNSFYIVQQGDHLPSPPPLQPLPPAPPVQSTSIYNLPRYASHYNNNNNQSMYGMQPVSPYPVGANSGITDSISRGGGNGGGRYSRLPSQHHLSRSPTNAAAAAARGVSFRYSPSINNVNSSADDLSEMSSVNCYPTQSTQPPPRYSTNTSSKKYNHTNTNNNRRN